MSDTYVARQELGLPPKLVNCRCDAVSATWRGLDTLINARRDLDVMIMSPKDAELFGKVMEDDWRQTPASIFNEWRRQRQSWDRDAIGFPYTCKTCMALFEKSGKLSGYAMGSCPHRNPPWTRRPPATLSITGTDQHGKTVKDTVGITWHEEAAPLTQSDWEKAKSRLGGAWQPIEPSKIDGEFSGSAESIMRKILSVYGLTEADLGIITNHQGRTMSVTDMCHAPGTCIICDAEQKQQGAQQRMPPISSNSASSLADEVRRLGKDHSIDLSGISSAIKQAEASRRSLVMDALRPLIRLEKAKNRPEGKRFILGYQHNDDEYVAHGIDYGYGEDIDEETDHQRVFLNDAPGIDYEYYTMARLEKSLKDSNIPHVIEYLD